MSHQKSYCCELYRGDGGNYIKKLKRNEPHRPQYLCNPEVETWSFWAQVQLSGASSEAQQQTPPHHPSPALHSWLCPAPPLVTLPGATSHLLSPFSLPLPCIVDSLKSAIKAPLPEHPGEGPIPRPQILPLQRSLPMSGAVSSQGLGPGCLGPSLYPTAPRLCAPTRTETLPEEGISAEDAGREG